MESYLFIITNLLFRKLADIVLLVYDQSDPSSFEKLTQLFKHLDQNYRSIPCLLVATKSDKNIRLGSDEAPYEGDDLEDKKGKEKGSLVKLGNKVCPLDLSVALLLLHTVFFCLLNLCRKSSQKNFVPNTDCKSLYLFLLRTSRDCPGFSLSPSSPF
jgi:hypothetical protein